MKKKGFQINNSLKALLFLSLGSLFVTGILWLTGHYLLAVNSDYGIVKSPLEPLSLKIHGLMAPLFLIVFGSLLPTHIIRALKAKQNFISGIMLLFLIAYLIATGYFLYYCGNETLRNISSISHSITGCLIILMLVIHIYLGKKIYSQERSIKF